MSSLEQNDLGRLLNESERKQNEFDGIQNDFESFKNEVVGDKMAEKSIRDEKT